MYDRTDNACTVSTSRCSIQSLRILRLCKNAWTVSTSRCSIQSLRTKALYGTTGGTYSPRVFRSVLSCEDGEDGIFFVSSTHDPGVL